MANRAYVSAWGNDYSEATQLEQFTRLLETVPSPKEGVASFGLLVVHAIDPTETPVREWDLRGRGMTAAEIADLLREHEGADLAFEIHASWDLWAWKIAVGKWQLQQQEIEIVCQGPEYDDGVSAEQGDFLIGIGPEHLFTGDDGPENVSKDDLSVLPGENSDSGGVQLTAAMIAPDRTQECHQRTRQNIQLLFQWLRKMEGVVPLERYRMWSEGEENFEARVDEILAVR
jgi:hypothetical protein